MRLRMSGEQTDDDYDLGAVIDAPDHDFGVPNGRSLNRFAEAVLGRVEQERVSAREAVVNELGPGAMVDAAAVIAAFNAYPRAADATGIPLEAGKAQASAGLRDELGLDRLDRTTTG